MVRAVYWTLLLLLRISKDPSTIRYRFNTPLFPPLLCLTCALLPLNRLCQMNASLSNNSISFSVQSRVGSACKNIMISWKSMRCSFSDHLTRNAAQT